MKPDGKITRGEEAVSPVIGVILMVAIAVILAAVIAALVFTMGEDMRSPPPIVSLEAISNGASSDPDIKILHTNGETVMGSQWKISVVPQGELPVYAISQVGDDLEAGAQLIITEETVDGSYNFTANSWSYEGGSVPISRGRYDVKMVRMPSLALLIDTVVEVR